MQWYWIGLALSPQEVVLSPGHILESIVEFKKYRGSGRRPAN